MEEEIKAAEVEVPVVTEEVAVPEPDLLAQKDAEIAKLTRDRDSYKTVALKRLGKLPGDADFIDTNAGDSGLTVEEQVRLALLEREITKAEQEKAAETARIVKENAELRLALKNRPGSSSIGGGSGDTVSVKDNVFSETQITELKKRAETLGLDPEKFIEKTKENLSKRG